MISINEFPLPWRERVRVRGLSLFIELLHLFTILNKKRLAEAIVEKTLENKKIESIVSRIKSLYSNETRTIDPFFEEFLRRNR